MALLIPPGYANVVLHWNSAAFESGRAATVFGAGEPLGPDPVGLTTFAETVATATETHLLPIMEGSLQLERVEVIGATNSGEASSGQSGGRLGSPPPPNVALLVRKAVSGRGRRRQGRMFLYGLFTTDEVGENGTVTSGRLQVVQDALADWYDEWATSASVNMVILQNSEGETPPISPPPVVTALQAQAKVASQRRRLRR